jgi:hypothetical protein
MSLLMAARHLLVQLVALCQLHLLWEQPVAEVVLLVVCRALHLQLSAQEGPRVVSLQ